MPSKKMKALDGPLPSWVTRHTPYMYACLNPHPRSIAVRLTDRGERANEAKRLMRTRGRKVGVWYFIQTEDVPRLRPVWVAGFRRMPTELELQRGEVLP